MLQCRLEEGIEPFIRLENAWNDLARSVATCHYTQTYAWCRLGWDARGNREGDRLLCATVWDGERLLAVWPFLASREGPITRIDPIGCGLREEYGEPLVATEANNAHVCRKLLQLLHKSADLMQIPFVRQGSPMQRALERHGAYTIPVPMETYAIEPQGADDFDTFLGSYSANFRANLKQQRKRLDKLGTLRFELLDDLADSVDTIDWMLAEKREWLRRTMKSHFWFHDDATRAFLVGASTLRSDLGRLGLFRLTLDGKPVAALMATIDRTRIEALVTSFDPAYGRYSPGMLLIGDATRWAFERGLTFDMRPFRSDYKERWANTTGVRISYFTPMTWKGAIHMFPAYLKFRLLKFLQVLLTSGQKTAIKAVLKSAIDLKGRIQSSVAQIGFRPAGEK